MREEIERFMSATPCPACGGYRLKPEALAVKIAGKHIGEVTELSIRKADRWFNELPVLILFVISFLVILLTMYTTIVERTREIGILRSLGATRGRILRLVVGESLLLCALGAAAGVVFTVSARLWLARSHPLLTMELGVWGIARSTLLALAGGVLGALYPGFRAARVDPVEALSYE